MNKAAFVAKVAEKTGVSNKQAEASVNAVLDTIVEAVKAGEKVQFIGFGSFEIKEREARTCRNPRTGEYIEVGPSKVPVFKASKSFGKD